MKCILLMLAVVLVMAAVAAPSALARVHVYCYEIRSPGDIVVVEVICGDPSTLLSKKQCEQARANDPAENVSEKCFKRF